MLGAAFLILVGSVQMHRNKNLNGKPHWTSSHGKLGITLLVTVIGYQTLVSVLTMWDYPQKVNEWLTRKVMRPLGLKMKSYVSMHRYVGRLAFVVAMHSMNTGWRKSHDHSPDLFAPQPNPEADGNQWKYVDFSQGITVQSYGALFYLPAMYVF